MLGTTDPAPYLFGGRGLGGEGIPPHKENPMQTNENVHMTDVATAAMNWWLLTALTAAMMLNDGISINMDAGCVSNLNLGVAAIGAYAAFNGARESWRHWRNR